MPTNWQRRVSLTENFSLRISPVTENDFGIFKCDRHELMNNKVTTFKLYEGKMKKRYDTNICCVLDNNPDIMLKDTITACHHVSHMECHIL